MSQEDGMNVLTGSRVISEEKRGGREGIGPANRKSGRAFVGRGRSEMRLSSKAISRPLRVRILLDSHRPAWTGG